MQQGRLRGQLVAAPWLTPPRTQPFQKEVRAHTSARLRDRWGPALSIPHTTLRATCISQEAPLAKGQRDLTTRKWVRSAGCMWLQKCWDQALFGERSEEYGSWGGCVRGGESGSGTQPKEAGFDPHFRSPFAWHSPAPRSGEF